MGIHNFISQLFQCQKETGDPAPTIQVKINGQFFHVIRVIADCGGVTIEAEEPEINSSSLQAN